MSNFFYIKKFKFTNGSIKVNFDDGSDLCMDRDNRIYYLHDGILDR